VKDPIADDEIEVEIDLGEIDWSALPEAVESAAVERPDAKSAPDGPAASAETYASAEVVETPAAAVETYASAEAASPAAVQAKPAPAEVNQHRPTSTKSTNPTPRAPAAAATPVAEARGEAEHAHQSFHTAFAEIVRGVEPPPLRALVGSTFARLLRVLDTLGRIEEALSRPQAVKVGFLFEEVRVQTASLLTHVNFALSAGDGLDPHLRDALDGVRFVIGHEMTKVFRQEFPGITTDSRADFSRADFSRAWGLLHNCLQQTAISLAQTFAPGVTGEQLFEDYKCKIENSLTLYNELTGLLHKVRAAEGSSGILLKHTLVRHLEHFRDETMRFLMYKDWGEFGRYVDKVRRAFEEMEDFESVLHEFAQYLGALIHHVGMREVLRSAPQHLREDAGATGPAPHDPFAERVN
jgi:hypothetical protein